MGLFAISLKYMQKNKLSHTNLEKELEKQEKENRQKTFTEPQRLEQSKENYKQDTFTFMVKDKEIKIESSTQHSHTNIPASDDSNFEQKSELK